LQHLADATTVRPHRPSDLWERGRRWHRRRTAGVAVIAAVTITALVTLSGLSWQRAAVSTAAAQGGEAVLPDRIYNPSPWLPGTADAGPPGQLVAVAAAERGSWTGLESGVAGISAITGEYRFLDLPDAVLEAESPAALSPDGHLVAYWVTGETTGSPRTKAGSGAPVVGVAVYDTRTGAVRRELISTEHGLATERLLWVDDDTLVFEFAQWAGGDGDSAVDQSTGFTQPPRIWRLEDDSSHLLTVQGLTNPSVVATAPGILQLEGKRPSRLWIVDADLSVLAQLHVRPGTLSSDLVVDPFHRSVAAVWGGGRSWSNPNDVVVSSLAPPSTAGPLEVQFSRVPGSGRTLSVLGWLDASDVAVVQHNDEDFLPFAVFALDVRTGEAVERTRLPESSEVEFATGLLDAPVVDAPAPQRPMDPRLVAGLGAVILVTALVAGLLWLRRARP